ncbi:MAG: hypothetical protein WCO58_02560 [bacterium]
MLTFFKKTITSILLVSFLIVAIPPKAEALDGASLGASLGSATASSLAGCLLGKGIISGLKEKAKEKAGSTLGTAAVKVDDKQQAKANNTKACIDAIAVSLARVVLQQLTESIVNWINSGFDGNPLYIRNRESFFASIENESINGLKNGLLAKYEDDPSFSPYAKSALRQLITDRKVSLSPLDNFKYTGPDPKVFKKDFSEGGGWAAWKSVTLSERNNPLGVSINLAEESDKLINQKVGAVQAELSQPNFLSVKKCVDPAGYVEAHKADPKVTCNRWEVVTPGSVVQNQINQALGTTGRQLEIANDVNTSVSKIFTALTDQLIKRGLSSLSKGKTTDSYASGGPGLNNSVSGISGGFTNGDASDWLKVAPNKPIDPRVFDHEILPDVLITQLSYIGDQKTLDQYSANKDAPSVARRIKQLNKASAGSGNVNYESSLAKYSDNLNEMTTDWCGYPLHDLSYCIPGPRPGWEDNADAVINSRLDGLHNALIKSVTVSGWQSFWKSIDAQTIINGILSVLRGSYRDSVDLYNNFISNTYVTNPNVMPIARTANKELELWPQYSQQILDNQNEAIDVMATTNQVFAVQKKMDNLMNRVYKRLADEAKLKYGPGQKVQVDNINALPIDPACLGTIEPFGGIFGNTGNANGTTSVGGGATYGPGGTTTGAGTATGIGGNATSNNTTNNTTNGTTTGSANGTTGNVGVH